MAHLIIEYSQNFDAVINIQDFLQAIHTAALKTGIFPIGGLRTRAVASTQYVIADGHLDNMFVHIQARIGSGRDEKTRQAASQTLFEEAERYLEGIIQSKPCGLSLEFVEIDPLTSHKANSLHKFVEDRIHLS